MASISDLVQKILLAGYLTIEAEEQLRKLLTIQYNDEDLNAFVTLQEAAMTGRVRQESRERLQRSSTGKRFAPNSPCCYASIERS
ncbi:hypothetical protein [Chlorogloea sp. CCALA 695]|uniref:hypothetical protein n=1 Tax=Chlorogloea sp. CCALA 695 TaxID=2107693 RepID=UPI000D053859|nr:hypothetical protein [Chlorogloea sp. CCALA 695]PSB32770.1 hypothetical protein C7B70_09595 [Chlorogloea sp. CCALA 695]